jgi:flagellar motor switch protein FliM
MEKDKALSQKEIDALLSIIPTDGAPLPGTDRFIGSARAYDFRSPDKFSKEQIRTLQMIHENFTRQVSSTLSAYLRTTSQIQLVHIEQGSFGDFIQNIPSPSYTNIIKMSPLPNRVLLALDPNTAIIAVDRLLGGLGNPISEEHQITDIEQSLIIEVVDYFIQGLKDAWKNVIDLNIVIEETTLNPQFAQVALPSDAAVFMAFELKVRESSGMMSIVIPYAVLKPIVSELSPHTWVAGESRDTGIYREDLLRQIKQIEIDVAVLLGEASVNFEELLHLQAGDVISLDSIVSRPLPILVGGTKKFNGQPGLVANRLSVQLGNLKEGVADG